MKVQLHLAKILSRLKDRTDQTTVCWNTLSVYLDKLFQGLNDGVDSESRNMTIYSILLVIVTLTCLALSINSAWPTLTVTCLALSLWYARKLGDMLSKMAKHAQKLQGKSVELSAEKKRADTLLCQMLPKEVAEQLKMNKEVKAERSKVKVDY